jgi:hypothetical protein
MFTLTKVKRIIKDLITMKLEQNFILEYVISEIEAVKTL